MPHEEHIDQLETEIRKVKDENFRLREENAKLVKCQLSTQLHHDYQEKICIVAAAENRFLKEQTKKFEWRVHSLRNRIMRYEAMRQAHNAQDIEQISLDEINPTNLYKVPEEFVAALYEYNFREIINKQWQENDNPILACSIFI